MTILDSSVWIALFKIDDANHDRALRIFADLKDTVILPEYILIEVTSVLALRGGDNSAHSFAKIALGNQQVRLLLSDQELFTNTLAVFLRQSKLRLSFIDSALVYLAKTHTVITFDRALQRALDP